MEEKIKLKNPTLHRYLFTVTTFSKLLALSLFIVLPFLGFYLGMQYQQKVTVSTPVVSEVQTSPSPTPSIKTYLGTNTYNKAVRFSIQYPALCSIKKVSYSPSEQEINCQNLGIEIIPSTGGHGMGDNPNSKITSTSADVILGVNNWKRTIFKNPDKLDFVTVVYELKNSNPYHLIEVDYSNSSYSMENQDFAENIITTFKFTQ